MEKITSSQNKTVKNVVKLKQAKQRHECGMFIAEGIKLIRELVNEDFKIKYCFASDKADLSELPSNIDKKTIFISTQNVMEKISSLTTPQDFIAVCEQKNINVSDTKEDFILALDNIQDPSNIGAILRSAEAFGVKAVVLSQDCCDVYSPKALRAAMGSTFRLNLIKTDLKEFLSFKKDLGYDIIGTGLDKSYKTTDKLCESSKKVVVIGNEGSGISNDIKPVCSFGMYIPMYGKNESLNAAVAASIILWENKRQNNE